MYNKAVPTVSIVVSYENMEPLIMGWNCVKMMGNAVFS